MVTAIISLSQVHGAEIWLLGWIACMLLYWVIVLCQKSSRTKSGIKNALFWFWAAELFTDMVWALVYYGNPGYINYGVAAVYGLFLWPVCLMVAAIIAARQNRSKIHTQTAR